MDTTRNSPVIGSGHADPFRDLTLAEIYGALRTSGLDTPRWPDEKLQKSYTGTRGVDLLRRAFEFTRMLSDDGAFAPGWKGLDYGCGWGRFASVLLTKGAPSQLDLSDAWPRTLGILSELGYRNKIFTVSELLKAGELPVNTYDFILSFSVFTHLSPEAFSMNIPVLLAAMKDGGRFYFTVRHDEFIDHKYADRAGECRRVLKRDGVLFLDSGGNLGTEKVFGDTVVMPEYLSSLVHEPDTIHYLGQPHSFQHVYAIQKGSARS